MVLVNATAFLVGIYDIGDQQHSSPLRYPVGVGHACVSERGGCLSFLLCCWIGVRDALEMLVLDEADLLLSYGAREVASASAFQVEVEHSCIGARCCQVLSIQ